MTQRDTTTQTAVSPEEDSSSLLGKQASLLRALSRLDSLLVAFSGGTDSAYLAWAAHTALGERALAVTALSPSFSAFDREHCERLVHHFGLQHEFIATDELANPLYVANSFDRCYHCKSELFSRLERLAAARHFAFIAYGINADDTADFRPGHRAAAEHRVLTPLLDAGLTKAEIRELARRAGLPAWDRPASACLASRIPYGTPVTPEALRRVERAEAALRELGFRQLRVRHFGEHARVEVAPDELPAALSAPGTASITEALRRVGYTTVEVDPRGYRQGALNESLPPDARDVASGWPSR
jgi:uncharacterized protein